MSRTVDSAQGVGVAAIGLAFVLLWGGLTAGCLTNGKPLPDGALGEPTGLWQWKESSGGIAGIHKTAASSGESWSLRFLGGGEYEEIRDGGPPVRVRYRIEARAAVSDGRAHPALVVDGLLDRIIERPDGKTLILIENVADGFTHLFERRG